MKAVRGMTLRDVLGQLEHAETGALLHFTLKRLLGIFHKVCDALAYAHAQGVTHGGVRPECIVLGDFGEVFVTQWRLPRALHGREHDLHEDIAALGRLLYEIVTLEPAGETTPAHGRPHAGHSHAKPSAHWAGDDSVRTLFAVACRAMDMKAADKFHSVQEFQTRVDVFKDSFHDPAQLTLVRLFGQWWLRYKMAIAIAITAAIVLGLVLVGLAAKSAVKNLLKSDVPVETSAPARPGENPAEPR